MADCVFSGNGDMYGIGIRIAFYLQWFTTILAGWIARSEVRGLDFSTTVFVTATFIALIIQTIQNNLATVEIYIILLLCFGGYLYLVPLYAWRIFTGCNPKLDPSRWSRVRRSKLLSFINFWLLIGVTCFQLWFWFSSVPAQNREDSCRRYGFLFSKIALDNRAFVALNITLQFLLLLCCIGVLVIWYGKAIGLWEERKSERPRRDQRLLLQKLRTYNNIIVAGTVIAATELTIKWNQITDINDLTSAGQLIPFLISLALVARVLYVGSLAEEGLPGGSHSGHRVGGSNISGAMEEPDTVTDFPVLASYPRQFERPARVVVKTSRSYRSVLV